MVSLHFICPHGLNHTPLGNLMFESGFWRVSDERADEAIGGRIYLHEHQDSPSWHGGTILSWRKTENKKMVFTYKAEGDIRIRCREGWGQEQATVRD